MALYSIISYDYDINIGKLAERRLRMNGVNAVAEKSTRNRMDIDISGDELDGFITAVAQMLYRDLRHFELARLVDLLPTDLRDKRRILPRALVLSMRHNCLEYVRSELSEYLQDNSLIVAEGFIRFRMPEVLEYWAMSVDRAGEELMIRREYEELMEIISDITNSVDKKGSKQSKNLPQAKEIRVIIQADGVCTLTDGAGAKLDCEVNDFSDIIGILIGISPERISVYDLSDGFNRELMETIHIIFGNKARFFVKTKGNN